MRFMNYFILLSGLSGLIPVVASSSEVPVAVAILKPGFVKEQPVSGVKKLLGWRSGNYYVARQDVSIDEIDSAGHKKLTLQAKDSKGSPLLKQPQVVAVADDMVYVADSENSQIAMFTLAGKYQGSFGTKRGGFFGGKAGVELSSPRGIAVHEGIVYVADTGNGEVQLFGINGVYLASLEIESSPANRDALEKNSLLN